MGALIVLGNEKGTGRPWTHWAEAGSVTAPTSFGSGLGPAFGS